MSAPTAHVIGLGAQTSIGLTLPTTVAAVHGAINRFTTQSHLRDRARGEPITLALLQSLPVELPVLERMRHLATEAARQALFPWRETYSKRGARAAALRVMLAIPRPRPGFPDDAVNRLLREVLGGLPVQVNVLGCSSFSGAHAGGLVAIARAASEITEGRADAILVGGVDSYADLDTLHWLELQERLKTDEVPFGVLPGEGAGFLLLASDAFLVRYGLRSFGRIVATSQAIEPNPWYLRRPSTVEGLTKAISDVLRPPGVEPRHAAVTYADLNGESWRAEEWNLAYTRTGQLQGHPLDLRHPADCWGDVGAASGTLLATLACLDLHLGYNPLGTALIYAAADVAPYRAACLVQRPEALGGEP